MRKAPKVRLSRGWIDPLNPPLSPEQRAKCERLSHNINRTARRSISRKQSNILDAWSKLHREAHHYLGIAPTLWDKLCCTETKYRERWRLELIAFSSKESLREDVRKMEAALKWEPIPPTLRASASLVLSRLHNILSVLETTTKSRLRN